MTQKKIEGKKSQNYNLMWEECMQKLVTKGSHLLVTVNSTFVSKIHVL